ncbi:MAG: endonuclease/exonuclease/phosphatase family protein [Dysgonomonas sp.]
MPVKNKKNLLRYGWYLILIINVLTIVLLFMSVLAWKISPAKTTFFAYLGLGFPFLLIINLLFLVFWLIFRKWKFVLLVLVTLVLCMKPALTYFPLHFAKNMEVPQKSIKVLSYNVMMFSWFRNKNLQENPVMAYIRDSGADIVCIQEYLAIEGSDKFNSREIKKALKHYPYHSVIKLEDLGDNKREVLYGIACFSKYPINKVVQIPVETRYNAGSVLYELSVNGKTISLFNSHLESNRLTDEDKKLYREFLAETNRQTFDEVTQNIRSRLGTAYAKRAPQADIVNQWIRKQKTDGIIVCGDFNDTPISYTYNRIKGDLVDSYTENGFGAGITYHENHFWFRIDFIMHSDNMQSYGFTVDKVKYSDHYPIWTYLKIN